MDMTGRLITGITMSTFLIMGGNCSSLTPSAPSLSWTKTEAEVMRGSRNRGSTAVRSTNQKRPCEAMLSTGTPVIPRRAKNIEL